MRTQRRIFTRKKPTSVRAPHLLLVLSGALALLTAWWLEHEMDMVPCSLCLLERWPWRALIALGLAGLVVPRALSRLFAWLGTLPLLAGVGLGVVHMGVERGWWKSPLPECNAPHLQGQTLAERLASMPLHPGKPCDQPSYLFDWLPFSLSELDGIASLLVLVALLGLLLTSGGRTRGQ